MSGIRNDSVKAPRGRFTVYVDVHTTNFTLISASHSFVAG